MTEIINEILKVFKEHGIKAGQFLPKEIMTENLKKFPPEKKVLIRDAWHFLIGNQFLMEGNPQGPVLTKKGEEYINKNLNS
jgi:hypothetical protein